MEVANSTPQVLRTFVILSIFCNSSSLVIITEKDSITSIEEAFYRAVIKTALGVVSSGFKKIFNKKPLTIATVATSTSFTLLGDTSVATTEKVGTASPITRYVHVDHLGSTRAITDNTGTVVQMLDYYPYGQVKANTGTYGSQKQYIGQYYDTDSALNYLNARYYDGGRGQFLSEDPIFWGKQNLQDPQGLNSYSYANGNPIVKKDPSGRCPQCLIGAGAGMLGQYGFDVYNNIQSNGLEARDFYSNLSSPKTYLTRAIQGAAVAATGGVAGALTANVAGQAVIVGAASGVIGAGGNYALGQPVSPSSVFWDTTIGGLTFGVEELVPGIPGRLPKLGTEAFYNGAHTMQSAAQLGVGAGSNYLSSLLSSVSFGPGASGPVFSGMPNFKGVYNFGLGRVYNFGTKSWIGTSVKKQK